MELQQRKEGDIVLIELQGTLDIQSAPEVREVFRELIEADERKVILNLSAVELLSSSGASNLVRLARELDELGGSLVLAEPSPRCVYVLDLLQLPDFFKTFKSEEQAFAFFND